MTFLKSLFFAFACLLYFESKNLKSVCLISHHDILAKLKNGKSDKNWYMAKEMKSLQQQPFKVLLLNSCPETKLECSFVNTRGKNPF